MQDHVFADDTVIAENHILADDYLAAEHDVLSDARGIRDIHVKPA